MIRDDALEEGSYSAAVQAEMGRAKLAGLLIDKKEIKVGKIDQMDRSEVEARLRNLIEKHELVQIQAASQMVEMLEKKEKEEEDA